MKRKFTVATIFLVVSLLTSCQKEPNVSIQIDCGKYNSEETFLTVNGKQVGQCPLDIKVVAGEINIQAQRDYEDTSYRHIEKNITLAENTTKKISLDMSKLEHPESYWYKRVTDIATAKEYIKKYPKGSNLSEVKQKLSEFKEKKLASEKTGIVTIKKLMWMRCSLGQTWNKNTESCDGRAKSYNYIGAMSNAKNFSYAGYNNWRVPTIEELESIVYHTNGSTMTYYKNGRYKGFSGLNYKNPTINSQMFPNTNRKYFWSASQQVNDTDRAWAVNFSYGHSFGSYLTSNRGVRLVRPIQWFWFFDLILKTTKKSIKYEVVKPHI